MSAILCHIVNGASVQSYHIEKEIVNIGRSVENDIFLDEQAVSSRHAVIDKMKKDDTFEYRLRDLESTNHTFVNNLKVDSKVLENNDLIRIGFTTLKFVNDTTVDLTATVKIKKSWIPGVYYTTD